MAVMPFFESSLRLLERASNLRARSDEVALRWFDHWTPECDASYEELGGNSWLPSTLLSEMLANQSVHRKGVALLARGGRPWALVPLRLAGAFWEPLTQGVIHGYALFLCQRQPELAISHLRLNVGFWDAPEPPTGWRGLRWSAPVVCYDLSLDGDPERYWRSTDLWKSIVRAKHRTAGFELLRDDFEATKWLIERWRDRFYTGRPREVSSKWGDRILAAKWGLDAGTVRSWVLRDGERYAGGVVTTVVDSKMTFGTVYRDPEYDWHSVGTRTFYEAFAWAKTAGIGSVSLGSLYDYKRRWAPASATHWNYVISPLPVHVVQGAVERAKQLLPAQRTSPAP